VIKASSPVELLCNPHKAGSDIHSNPASVQHLFFGLSGKRVPSVLFTHPVLIHAKDRWHHNVTFAKAGIQEK
jgi:hypothetical protein